MILTLFFIYSYYNTMFYILSAIFLWSSLGIFIRFSGVSVHLLIFFSNSISLFIMGLLFLKKDYRKEIPRNRALLPLLVLGPVSLVNTFSFFYAYRNTSIANAVLTHYTAPVIVAFLAPVFLKERLTGKVALAVAVATAGLWLMLGISAGQFLALFAAGDKNTAGIFAGLFSGLAYAVLIIVIRSFAQNSHPLIMTFFQNLIISLIMLPFVEMRKEFGSAIWIFLVMGIVHSTVAPALYFKGMKQVTANKAAILGYLEPVCAILLGVVFLGETVNYKVLAGGAMILFSGYITIAGDRQ